MPLLRLNGTELFYEERGTGRQAVFFAHGLGMSGRMFHHQVHELRTRYRCITMDFRGQGRSAIAERGYDMDTLARDAAGLMRKLETGPCHYVGLSMGGFVGMRLAIERPELLRSLTLLNTSAQPEPLASRLQNGVLVQVARFAGLRPVIGPVMRKLFGATFLRDPARAEERRRWREHLLAVDREGIVRAARAVMRREGVSSRLGEVTTPTLIIAGDEDIATPPVLGQRIHEQIAGSEYLLLPDTGHTSCIEQAQQVTLRLQSFIAAH